jgi:hypothetical protein
MLDAGSRGEAHRYPASHMRDVFRELAAPPAPRTTLTDGFELTRLRTYCWATPAWEASGSARISG